VKEEIRELSLMPLLFILNCQSKWKQAKINRSIDRSINQSINEEKMGER
jgi:hypothetical protein